jgi:Collagen triple helix repeat (20 copies)
MLKRRLKEPFGKAGLVVGILALVFAMVGGAFAASNNGGGNATASAKAKQGKQGKTGKTGKTGAQGIAGTNGTNGTNGKDGAPGAPGKDGEDGQDGASGANGKNVVTGTETTGTGNCEGRGGATVEVQGEAATKKYACNGKNGQTGFTETLPSGKTETGVWSVRTEPGEEGVVSASFNIPLGTDLPLNNAKLIPEGEEEKFETECPGSPNAPKASPGFACFYTTGALLPAAEAFHTTSRQGVVFLLQGEGGEGSFAYGTWAVTAE